MVVPFLVINRELGVIRRVVYGMSSCDIGDVVYESASD